MLLHPWDFPGKSTGVVCHFLLQRIFPTQGSNLSLLRCRQKAMAPRSSTLASQILWTEEPGRLQSMGSLGVGHNWETSLSLFIFMHWRRKWQPTPVFLLGESQGWGSPVGCRLWGHRVGHDRSDLAVAVVFVSPINCFHVHAITCFFLMHNTKYKPCVHVL